MQKINKLGMLEVAIDQIIDCLKEDIKASRKELKKLLKHTDETGNTPEVLEAVLEETLITVYSIYLNKLKELQ